MSKGKNVDTKTEAAEPGIKDALKAEPEAMEAKNEAEKEADMKQPLATATAAAEPEMEEIFIPRGYANDEPNLLVSINGHNYLLPKGKKSKVPAHVAREIRRSWKAQEIADQHISEMLEASK